LAAGASRALLLRATDDKLVAAGRYIRRLVARGDNVIVESNRIVEHCKADLVIFVVDPTNSDWKSSSPICIRRAHAIVLIDSDDLPEDVMPLVEWPSGLRHFQVARGSYASLGFQHWFNSALAERHSLGRWGASLSTPANRIVRASVSTDWENSALFSTIGAGACPRD
jgi:hypothetical protein